jgi:uncharacterized protein
VHISALADRFVKDPHAVVKSGDLVKVKVMEVDLVRKRIALSMRLGDVAPERAAGEASDSRSQGREPRPRPRTSPGRTGRSAEARPAPGGRAATRAKAPAPAAAPGGGTMADAFAKAKRR